ncbi:hypothetical protein T4C_5235 [Trichinella pseudospiralis]|uniref:Uncharacterized protein n=1 Tax=Trichinella pseudospiralis TaxID=6337 RepID=A0A0V1H7V3_TRIPS|nr:hypothetical protein T4C_5235 [Trichinella pseudospiralis]
MKAIGVCAFLTAMYALLNSSNKEYWKIQKLRGHLAIML